MAGALAAGVAAVLLATGCAHPWQALQLAPGTPRDQVVAQAGAPTRVVPLPGGGERLQYAQPAARTAFMIDIDAAGRLVRARQVLASAEFDRIQADRWTRADVDREFGPPHAVDGVASWRGPIYTYRWRDSANERMLYWVYFDPQGVVRRHHPGIDHANVFDELRR